jgi:thioredoxin 1
MKRKLFFSVSVLFVLLVIVFATTHLQKNYSPETQFNIGSNEALITFIELGSVNCIPCRMMQPVMKSIGEKYGKQVKILFYDVWTNKGSPYAKLYKIRVIPTQVFLDPWGREILRHQGYFPLKEIEKFLETQGLKQGIQND